MSNTRRTDLMLFYVSRQRQWPDGNLSVEVAQGGPDYSNPGEITPHRALRALGEGRTYRDPVEAVEAAIAIRKAWIDIRKAGGDADEPIGLGFGFTHGCTMPFSDTTEQDALERAQKVRDGMGKCDQCGELLHVIAYRLADDNDERFCSSGCAENREADLVRFDNEAISLATSAALELEDVEDIP